MSSEGLKRNLEFNSASEIEPSMNMLTMIFTSGFEEYWRLSIL